ncbi:uncharacterized protein [Glycine max]|uniref:uncharacterized protein n=1 Tax=Glycine max TaxID=3847 RepID=UPI001B3545F9|nr:uncharacterized protein LOC102659897 [Glycine max]
MASSCRGYSKAQMCFFKILRIISSTPPSKQEEEEPFPSKGVGIDLNLRFCSVTETPESESSRSDENNNEEEEGFPEKSVEVSEKLDFFFFLFGGWGKETTSFKGRDGHCFDLLIYTFNQPSGKDEPDSGEESGLGGELKTRRASEEKRREKWVVVDLYGDVLEETEPVVRSKRGRNQALPYRFRDSVVEPLKRATRSQRPSSTAHLSKRLLGPRPQRKTHECMINVFH